MLLIHESHVFKLRVKRKFEMCYPWSNCNATSVLQHRKPGKIEKEKETKTKQSNHMESPCYCPIKSSFSKKNVFFVPPPKKNKKTKQRQKKNNNNNTKQNIRAKNNKDKNSKKERF